MEYKRIYLLILLLISSRLTITEEVNPKVLGGWAISIELFQYIRAAIKPGSAILELGSGSGTGELAKYYTMHSVEHNTQWLNKYESNYIFAPIKNYQSYRWYNVQYLQNLPQKYSLILIDGPVGTIGRYGFYHHMNLFNTNVTMIFDDAQRPAELKLLQDVANKLRRPYKLIKCSDGKTFGVID